MTLSSPPPAAATRPQVTPDELVARARELAPLLREHSAETERLTRPPDAVHEACLQAGIYHTYIPRRYGGLEFDVTTYLRVFQELARGDLAAAWCVGLAAAHALQVGSWFPESAQDALFGDGVFRAASVAAPIGPIRRIGDEWELRGRVGYCSGIPFSTHYLGTALAAGDDGRPTGRMLIFACRAEDFEIEDDWGELMGLRGTGSNTITFSGARIPADWVLEDAVMLDMDVPRQAPGAALHDNPMYGGRAMACFTLSLAAIAIGGAYAMLDEYEEMMRTKLTPLTPMVPRIGDETYQRWYGSALVKLKTAEAAIHGAGEQHMAACRRQAAGGAPVSYGEDMLIAAIAREAMVDLWEVAQAEIFRTAGSSAARHNRFERLFRDLAMLNSHRNTMLREWAWGEVGRAALGEPRIGVGNVQDPHRAR
jgi:3-hydroxy-9,10-secoandrosta-1,3,5(10)-triene-9,17-dione monooxygenase